MTEKRDVDIRTTSTSWHPWSRAFYYLEPRLCSVNGRVSTVSFKQGWEWGDDRSPYIKKQLCENDAKVPCDVPQPDNHGGGLISYNVLTDEGCAESRFRAAEHILTDRGIPLHFTVEGTFKIVTSANLRFECC